MPNINILFGTVGFSLEKVVLDNYTTQVVRVTRQRPMPLDTVRAVLRTIQTIGQALLHPFFRRCICPTTIAVRSMVTALPGIPSH